MTKKTQNTTASTSSSIKRTAGKSAAGKTQNRAGTSSSVKSRSKKSGAAAEKKSVSSGKKKKASLEKDLRRSELRSVSPAEESPELENTELASELESSESGKELSRTNEKCDTFKLYVKEAAAFELLSVEEETFLAHQIHHGIPAEADAALDRLISSNLRLVVKIAHDFKGKGLELQDLISEGNVGLMRAAEKFDPGKGAKFSSYAAWWIKQSIRRAIANQRSAIRIPVQSGCKIALLRKTMHQYIAETGKHPSAETLAEITGLTVRTVRTLLLADHRVVSLQDQIREGEDGSIMELVEDVSSLAPDRECQDKEELSQMFRMLHLLTDREREIIQLRFGLHPDDRVWTLEEVSRKVKRTRERVRQLQNQALEKLRSFLTEENISCA